LTLLVGRQEEHLFFKVAMVFTCRVIQKPESGGKVGSTGFCTNP